MSGFFFLPLLPVSLYRISLHAKVLHDVFRIPPAFDEWQIGFYKWR